MLFYFSKLKDLWRWYNVVKWPVSNETWIDWWAWRNSCPVFRLL